MIFFFFFFEGMASVKWLKKIEIAKEKFKGFQMRAYTYVTKKTRKAVNKIKVRSLFIPPGVPSFYSRERYIEVNQNYEIFGRAWAGDLSISRVEYSLDSGGSWFDAQLLPNTLGKYAWTGFVFNV